MILGEDEPQLLEDSKLFRGQDGCQLCLSRRGEFQKGWKMGNWRLIVQRRVSSSCSSDCPQKHQAESFSSHEMQNNHRIQDGQPPNHRSQGLTEEKREGKADDPSEKQHPRRKGLPRQLWKSSITTTSSILPQFVLWGTFTDAFLVVGCHGEDIKYQLAYVGWDGCSAVGFESCHRCDSRQNRKVLS